MAKKAYLKLSDKEKKILINIYKENPFGYGIQEIQIRKTRLRNR